MFLQFLIYMVVVLITAIYYITIILHFFGVKMYNRADLKFGLAFIPFYYWFTRGRKPIY